MGHTDITYATSIRNGSKGLSDRLVRVPGGGRAIVSAVMVGLQFANGASDVTGKQVSEVEAKELLSPMTGEGGVVGRSETCIRM